MATNAKFVLTAEDRATRVLAGLRDEFGRLDKAAVESSKGLLAARSFIAGKGALGIAGAVAGIAGAGVGLAKSLEPFNKAMQNVRSIAGDIDDVRFKGLRSEVLSLAREMGVDATEAAKGLYDILGAGIPANAGLNVLRESLKASVAGVTDAKTAADGITTALNSYGLEATEAARISDLLFTTVAAGKATFEQVASNLAVVASVASSSKVPIEELLSIFATLSASGVKPEVAFTQIRSAITGMLSPTDELKTLLQQQGFATAQAAIESQGFAKTLQRIYEDSDKGAQLIQALGGRIEALQAVLGIVGTKAEKFSAIYKQMGESVGATDKAFAINADTLTNRIEKLKGSFVSLADQADRALKITEGFKGGLDALNDIAKGADEAARLNAELKGIKADLKLKVEADDPGFFIKAWENTFGRFVDIFEDELATVFVQQEQELDKTRKKVIDLKKEAKGRLFDYEESIEALQKLGNQTDFTREQIQDFQKKAADIRLNLGISSDAEAEIAKLEGSIHRLEQQRDSLASSPWGEAMVAQLDAQISKERELLAASVDRGKAAKAAAEASKAAEAARNAELEEQKKLQEQLKELSNEFAAAYGDRIALAQKELGVIIEKYAQLVREKAITSEMFAEFVKQQADKLGLLDEEKAKRKEIADSIKDQSKEDERAQEQALDKAQSLRDSVATEQERLTQRIREIESLRPQLDSTPGLSADEIIDRIKRAAAEASPAVRQLREELEQATSEAASILEDAKTPLEEFREQIARIQTLTERGLIPANVGAELQQRLTAQFRETGKVWTDVVGSMRGAFNEFLETGEFDAKSFVASLLTTFATNLAEKSLFKPLEEALTKPKVDLTGFNIDESKLPTITIPAVPRIDAANFPAIPGVEVPVTPRFDGGAAEAAYAQIQGQAATAGEQISSSLTDPVLRGIDQFAQNAVDVYQRALEAIIDQGIAPGKAAQQLDDELKAIGVKWDQAKGQFETLELKTVVDPAQVQESLIRSFEGAPAPVIAPTLDGAAAAAQMRETVANLANQAADAGARMAKNISGPIGQELATILNVDSRDSLKRLEALFPSPAELQRRLAELQVQWDGATETFKPIVAQVQLDATQARAQQTEEALKLQEAAASNPIEYPAMFSGEPLLIPAELDGRQAAIDLQRERDKIQGQADESPVELPVRTQDKRGLPTGERALTNDLFPKPAEVEKGFINALTLAEPGAVQAARQVGDQVNGELRRTIGVPPVIAPTLDATAAQQQMRAMSESLSAQAAQTGQLMSLSLSERLQTLNIDPRASLQQLQALFPDPAQLQQHLAELQVAWDAATQTFKPIVVPVQLDSARVSSRLTEAELALQEQAAANPIVYPITTDGQALLVPADLDASQAAAKLQEERDKLQAQANETPVTLPVQAIDEQGFELNKRQKDLFPSPTDVEQGFTAAILLAEPSAVAAARQVGGRVSGELGRTIGAAPVNLEGLSTVTFQPIESAAERASRNVSASWLKGTQTITQGFEGMKGGVLGVVGDLVSALTRSFAGSLSAGGGGGINWGNILTSVLGSLFRFDGGGFTGSGPRSGGVDGIGGFPAILHPQEQVIDLTRTSNSGAADGMQFTQVLNITPGVSREMVPQIQRAAAEGALRMLEDRGKRRGARAQRLGF